MENINITLPETLMDKSEQYTLTDEEKRRLISRSVKLLKEYDYDVTEAGVTKVIERWAKQNGWIINLFRKHPNYNGNFQIVLPSKLKRPINTMGISEFMDWSITALKRSFKEIHIGMIPMSEYEAVKSQMSDIYNALRRVNAIASGFGGAGHAVFNGRTANDYLAEYNRMDKVMTELEDKSGPLDTVSVDGKRKYISSSDYRAYRSYFRIIERLLGSCTNKSEPNIITQEDCDAISRWTDAIGIAPIAGQRVVKYIRKLLVKFGLDHIVDIQCRTWRADDGTFHSREMDMGYNHYVALLGDSINPLDTDAEIVLSVNPIDYWTMSFGYNWASCHTIDKQNTRGNGSDNYQGCYSGGTESYMLDNSSFIVYSRPNREQLEKIDEQDLPIELQSKMKRCVFMMGEDKLVQSRLYPDGRDGGDEGLAAQFRRIVQTTIAELYHTANMWTLKTGTAECRCVINTADGASHYVDYAHYSDCNVSYLRRVDGLLNTKSITVGAYSICPSCGNSHSDENWIVCYDCREGICCFRCGDRVDFDGDAIRTTDGTIFCCSECAGDSGYVYAEDEQEWCRRNDCMYEETSDTWYYDETNGITVEGNYGESLWFHDEEAAEYAGYRETIDGDWINEDDVREVGDTGEYFEASRYDDTYVETIDGRYFPTPESAEENGYWQDKSGDWRKDVIA